MNDGAGAAEAVMDEGTVVGEGGGRGGGDSLGAGMSRAGAEGGAACRGQGGSFYSSGGSRGRDAVLMRTRVVRELY